jgi:hypothetical protein
VTTTSDEPARVAVTDDDNRPERAPIVPGASVPAPTDEPATRPSGRGWRAVVIVAIVAALLTALIVWVSVEGGENVDDRVVTIPAGTGERIAQGQAVDVIDAVVRLEPGQELVVVNDDARLHSIGPITVEPGQTGRQAFTAEGRYPSTTSVRADGRITILVRASD